jgi:ABC-type proline/glycine betaine transport system permease subunit
LTFISLAASLSVEFRQSPSRFLLLTRLLLLINSLTVSKLSLSSQWFWKVAQCLMRQFQNVEMLLQNRQMICLWQSCVIGSPRQTMQTMAMVVMEVTMSLLCLVELGLHMYTGVQPKYLSSWLLRALL